jgi:hypothetical protein
MYIRLFGNLGENFTPETTGGWGKQRLVTDLLPRAVAVGVTTSDPVTTYGPYRRRTKDRGYRAIV